MRKLLLAASAMAALVMAAPVGAADLAVKGRPLPPPPPACAQFGGFYVGGYVGGGAYDHNWTDRDDFLDDVADDLRVGDANFRKTGFIGGVQGGYNWQWHCTVLGVQVDYGWSSIKASKDFRNDPNPASAGEFGTVDITSKLQGVGTLRTRTGLVVDNLLLYVTGGLAWANFDRSFVAVGSQDFPREAPVTEVFSSSKTKWGWVVGVGAEWAIWGNWSLQSEVLYAQFQNDTQTFFSPTLSGAQFRIDHDDSVWITKIGLNYRFGWGAGHGGY